MNEWTAFWLAVAVYVICEAVVVLHGIDTAIWRFKTPEEKALQQAIIERAKEK